MKNLQEIKNTYAQENDYEDWEKLRCDYDLAGIGMEMHMDEICVRAQKVALEKAAENAEIICKRKTVNCKQCYSGGCENPIVERESITNPENLIR